MRYKLTVLNIATFVFLLGSIVYTVANYSTLSDGEGWGVVYMIGLFIFGATALIIDLIIQRLVKSKKTQFILSIAAMLIYVALFFSGC